MERLSFFGGETAQHLAKVEQHAEESGVLHQLQGLSPRGTRARPLGVQRHRVDLCETREEDVATKQKHKRSQINIQNCTRLSNLPLEEQQNSVHDPHDEVGGLLELPHGGDVCRLDGLHTHTHTHRLCGKNRGTNRSLHLWLPLLVKTAAYVLPKLKSRLCVCVCVC